MDLKQRKLNRSEWNSIEISVSSQEMDVLNMIMEGYLDVNIRINKTNSIFTFLKIEYSEKMEDFVYNKYLKNRGELIENELKVLDGTYKKMKIDCDVKLNSADKVRLERFDESSLKKNDVFENVLLTHMEQILFYKKKVNNKLLHFHYFTLYKLINTNVLKLNRHIKELVARVLKKFEDVISTVAKSLYRASKGYC